MARGAELLRGFFSKIARKDSQQRMEQRRTDRQPDAPPSGEQWTQRKTVISDEIRKLTTTAERLRAASFDPESEHEPIDLQVTAAMHDMIASGMQQTISTLEGNTDAVEKEVTAREALFPDPTLIADFSNENTNRSPNNG
jgi:hypothetical protein